MFKGGALDSTQDEVRLLMMKDSGVPVQGVVEEWIQATCIGIRSCTVGMLLFAEKRQLVGNSRNNKNITQPAWDSAPAEGMLGSCEDMMKIPSSLVRFPNRVVRLHKSVCQVGWQSRGAEAAYLSGKLGSRR